jgi:hypothetical protein
MTEYCKGRIYPNSVPEFKMVQKENGAMVMQVRNVRNRRICSDPVCFFSKYIP